MNTGSSPGLPIPKATASSYGSLPHHSRPPNTRSGTLRAHRFFTPETLAELYSVHRRNTRHPFVPPNPNEFDMAYSMATFRGAFGTKSRSQPSPGFSRFMVGGTIWSRSASTVMPASNPPAPPNKCPVIDLVELTSIL